MNLTFLRGIGTGCAIAGALAFGIQDLWPKTAPATAEVVMPEPSQEAFRYHVISSVGTPTIAGVERKLCNHILHYSHEKKVPLWVQEHLDADSLKGSADRANVKFASDIDVDPHWRSHSSDYHRSGWSRGHMTPAANNKMSASAMKDTFLLSNIVPQDYDNNSKYWARLELHCRMLVKKYSNVWVTTGPAFIPKNVDGKNVVSYQVIGENEVAVPTHLYKVILAETDQGRKCLAAFMVPNAPIPPETLLTEFKVPLDSLEKRLGFRFYSNVDRSNVYDLCESGGCNMISDLAFKQYVYSKQLYKAKNIDKLNNVWERMKREGVPANAKLQEVYDVKKSELTEKASAAAAAAPA